MVTKVIDVSRYQGKVNWDVVKSAGIQGAMIRAVSSNGGGPYIDPEAERNYIECKRLHIPCGVYYYTYALNTTQAEAELSLLHSFLKGKSFEMPIAADVEDGSLRGLGVSTLTALVAYQLQRLESWGAYAMLYTYTYFKRSLDMRQLAAYDLWIADYRGVKPDDAMGMWQFSSKNTFGIPGFGNSLDCNYCYRDYPGIMKKTGLNDFASDLPPVDNGLHTLSIGPLSAGDMHRVKAAVEPLVDELRLHDLYHID